MDRAHFFGKDNMTIIQAIIQLGKLRDKYGDDIAVYFDCPNCNKSFSPDKVVTTAVHLTQDKQK
jgi:hypothetical protein